MRPSEIKSRITKIEQVIKYGRLTGRMIEELEVEKAELESWKKIWEDAGMMTEIRKVKQDQPEGRPAELKDVAIHDYPVTSIVFPKMSFINSKLIRDTELR